MAGLPHILDVTVIEKAVEERLVQMVPAIKQAAIRKDAVFGHNYLYKNPALAVSIYESGTFEKVVKYGYRIPVTINVLLTFHHPGDEDLRRKGINPLVFAIILALSQQTLGLQLEDPGVEPKRWRDVSDQDDFENKKCVYLIEFEAKFIFKVPADEDTAADLIGIAIDYYSESANVLTAQDELTP